jgi:hypothetical protein
MRLDSFGILVARIHTDLTLSPVLMRDRDQRHWWLGAPLQQISLVSLGDKALVELEQPFRRGSNFEVVQPFNALQFGASISFARIDRCSIPDPLMARACTLHMRHRMTNFKFPRRIHRS